MADAKLTFEDWLHEVDKIAAEWFGPETFKEPYTVMTGADSWRDMYDDGFSPEDAWDEEVSAMAW